MKFHNGVVITGGIASGKSSVCEILNRLGYKIISADEISHEMLVKSRLEIIENFGDEILDQNGEISRKKLGEIVFNNKDKLRILEQILHPKIRVEILSQCENFEKLIAENALKKPYFVEIPLFFESKNYSEFDQILVVFVPEKIALERLVKRNNLNIQEAKKRINLQLNIEEKCKKATFVIDNSAKLDELEIQVKNLLANF